MLMFATVPANIQYLSKALTPFSFAVVCAFEEFKQKIPDEYRTLFSLPAPVINLPVLNKFGWFVLSDNPSHFNIPKLVLFHFLLHHYGYITCTYEEFEQHFIDEKKFPENKIVWSGDVMTLVLLFDVLMNDKKIIPPTNNLYDLLCDHFKWIDKRNNTIKLLARRSLKSSLSAAKSNDSIRNIVKNITYHLLS